MHDKQILFVLLAISIVFLFASFAVIIQAQTQTPVIVWSPYLSFQFTLYNTTLQSSQPWVFSGFSLSNSSLTFYNTYVGSGATPINSLTITSPNANLTLDNLSITGTTDINATGNGLAIISINGFLEAPLAVTNGGTPFQYTYSRGTDTLTLYPILSGSSELVLTMPNLDPNLIINIFGLSLTALSLFAIVPIISVSGLIISSLLMVRSGRKLEPKEIIIPIVVVIVINVVVILAILIISGFQNAVTTITFLKFKGIALFIKTYILKVP